jgi:hypothetical protein
MAVFRLGGSAGGKIMRTGADPLLVVPVREGETTVSLRLFRTVAGGRTAVAFTSPSALAGALGQGQSWIRLSEPALRQMLADVGVAAIVVDPAGTVPAPHAVGTVPAPQAVGSVPAPQAGTRYEARHLQVA